MLTRDQILAADDLRRVEVKVPEWGGAVFVQMMSGAARDEFEASIVVDGVPDTTNMRAKLAAATIVDDNGNLLFTAADVAALSRKSAAALDRVLSAAQKLNRIGDKELKELVGN